MTTRVAAVVTLCAQWSHVELLAHSVEMKTKSVFQCPLTRQTVSSSSKGYDDMFSKMPKNLSHTKFVEVHQSPEQNKNCPEKNKTKKTAFSPEEKVCRKSRKKQHIKTILCSTRASQSLSTADQKSATGVVFHLPARLFPCAPVYEHADSEQRMML